MKTLMEGDIERDRAIDARNYSRIETRKWAVEQAPHHDLAFADPTEDGPPTKGVVKAAKALEAYVMGDEK